MLRRERDVRWTYKSVSIPFELLLFVTVVAEVFIIGLMQRCSG
jgi:hypothetical protein